MANGMPFAADASAEEEMPSEMEDEDSPIEEEVVGGEVEEMAEEPMGPPASLEDGVASLVESWEPTTPEGEKYLADLERVLGEAGGGMEEEMMGEDAAAGPMGLADLRNSVASKLGPMLGGPAS
jgi:hypothetical protein